MPARTGAERVPEDLRIHVRMPIDEAWRDHMTLGVDDFAGRIANLADGHDPAGRDANIGAIAGQAGAINDHAVTNHDVVLHSFLLDLEARRRALDQARPQRLGFLRIRQTLSTELSK